ncbi:hypothetical protein AUEXF2481DRAFT_8166 [Aureobasidium subglaciale EXF-2481]|uniref:Uncharacterized protein n=1 Tax=Aureobasidium subglaciale (strain EXF-2481) TaxID=1043005 RepID=A0A074YCT1_AURSE|nr:uncharacterized protein AUEXF2481DRAFT_8166 [Aureobasidium subglaciale EXF-2481]KAI5204099.1 hypothetical protein E4T38_04894 [Aureobasidium subglaciale]KAI5222790.1 hypothetical protein E4T40_04808 [Aureobasidium subglaciale]KAI5226616.1 hypothetical protein E4T41_04751 [Aureobasidium subglaciale]KAI5263044.1 hypothetical protein E4T46_03996 [Aureobasidium subglaciale]KEQ91942.1 hypothetical protein AUEXF2481DRAFT_8166 [Aureobasidium subglaciale EXF-2481]
MRMTRAQAAAQAAAESEVSDNAFVRDERSSTPEGEPLAQQEREPLGELTNKLDLSQDTPVVAPKDAGEPAETAEEVDLEQEKKELEESDPKDDPEEDQVSTPAVTPTTNKPSQIPIHQDTLNHPSEKDLDISSPTTELPLLNITPQRTPAKKIMKNEYAHMRSTSNKENMVPDSSVVTTPVDRLQTHIETLGAEHEQSEPQTPHRPHPEEQAKSDGKQKSVDVDHQEVEVIPQTGQETPQVDEAHDDSLINHFEALQVSPKKTNKFREQTVEADTQADAEELAASPPETTEEAKQDTIQASESQTPKGTETASLENKSKAALTSTTKKPSPQTSQPDASKPTRRPSVKQTTLGRQSSVVRKSMAPPARSDSSTNPAIKRNTSVRSSIRPSTRVNMAPRPASSQSAEPSNLANIPHSKPRPMSMSFPTPPPPARSSKAPTQATFQLPGEAIAARLKADKEARLQRQAEAGTGSTKSTYKPPPPPKSSKPPTKATFQLPGEAVAAKLKAEKEERQKRQEENGGVAAKKAYIPPVTTRSTKPVTKATFQLSSDVFAAKMKAQKEERLKKEKEEEEKREAVRKSGFKARPVPRVKEPAVVRMNAASRARIPSGETNGITRTTSVRDSTSLAQKRLSSFHPTASSSSTAALPPRAATSFQKRQSMAPFVSKGKEVFGRAVATKEKEDKEKKEKEEAAKKARAEAAEKGRQASRDWAAKKKEKERRQTIAAATAAVV